MNAPTQVEGGWFDVQRSTGSPARELSSTQLASFSLRFDSATPRQVECLAENPICRLAARTPEGASVCNKGCGIPANGAGAEHTCPLGLVMRRVGTSALDQRWIGRRFPTATAMHEMLDRLATEGFLEETILSSLPPNPVVSLRELAQAAEEAHMAGGPEPVAAPSAAAPLNGRALLNPLTSASDFGSYGSLLHRPASYSASAFSPSVAASSPAPTMAMPPSVESNSPAPVAPQPTFAATSATTMAPAPALANVLEYIEQIQSLLAGATRPDAIADRFLRAVGGLLPFEEMALYLADPAGGDYVLAASLDAAPSSSAVRAPQARPCRLVKGDLGWMACEQGELLAEQQGRVQPWRGEVWSGPGALALPLPLSLSVAPGDRVGVWLARSSRAAASVKLGEPVRLMRLLGEMLGLRLRSLTERAAESTQSAGTLAGASAAPNACPTWDENGLIESLRPEAARAARFNSGVALLRLRISGASVEFPLATAQIGAAVQAGLRPYDRLGVGAGGHGTWDVIAPLAQPEAARAIAERLLQATEDVMDAHGGMEEQGLRVVVGISLWGSDATTVEKMIEHAERASVCSSDMVSGDPIRVYDPEWPEWVEPEDAPVSRFAEHALAKIKLAAARSQPRRRRLQA